MDLDELDPDPHLQFDHWLAEAGAAGVRYPEAMTFATTSADGAPSARMVLLKAHDERGFVFYTNLRSRKARELCEGARAALVFYWEPQGRQVRVEGSVTRVGDEEARAYFALRPRGSQLGAWASPQSRPIASRSELERRLAEIEARFAAVESVPLPAFWGGYRVSAKAIEFWQGRPDRLHDRVRYEHGPDRWTRWRLAP